MRSSWKVPTTDGKKWFKTTSMRCKVMVSTAKDDCIVGGKDILSSAKWKKVIFAEQKNYCRTDLFYMWGFFFCSFNMTSCYPLAFGLDHRVGHDICREVDPHHPGGDVGAGAIDRHSAK